MCDEDTERDNEALLSRRQVGFGVAATLLTACGTRTASSPAPEPAVAPAAAAPAPAPATARRDVTIATPDGEADAVLFAPAAGGKHPGVILWPDIAGLRPAFETMAARLAEAGYAVLLANPYYRSAKGAVLTSFEEWRTDAGRAKIEPMRAQLTPEAVARDGAAYVAWLDQQPEVDPARKIGAQGYCMSGPYAIRAAAAAPERVGAVASFHGAGLVTDQPDSPHLLLPKGKAAALICIAQNDHERDPSAKTKLEQAAAGVTAEIEVYPANHGWCPPDSPAYDEAQAERAWARLLATYAAHL